MDTGTHVVMGISLGGLALLDPVVSADPQMAHAVMIATIAGSQAPDIDTVLKLKNNAVYIRNHRGFTHSIPAVLFWSLLIPAVIFPFVPGANLLHLWLWTLLAVVLHVFVDIFNAYGTQAIRPFSKNGWRLGSLTHLIHSSFYPSCGDCHMGDWRTPRLYVLNALCCDFLLLYHQGDHAATDQAPAATAL